MQISNILFTHPFEKGSRFFWNETIHGHHIRFLAICEPFYEDHTKRMKGWEKPHRREMDSGIDTIATEKENRANASGEKIPPVRWMTIIVDWASPSYNHLQKSCILLLI